MKLEDLKTKKILVLGVGREGKDTLAFLRKKFPSKTIGVADQKFNKEYLQTLKDYDTIIKSPGISPHTIAPFITKKQTVTSQTDIFFENCEGTIIGITGTKGKSTTASLIFKVLKAGGLKAHLIGNIGEPVLSYLEKSGSNDIFVYELSSFQLTNLKQSPHIAVLLNVYPEHLDYYKGNFKEYAAAKANIAKYQTETDFLIYNKDDKNIAAIAKQSKAQKIPFGRLRNLVSKSLETKFLAPAEPARIIGKLFGIPRATIESAIRNFKPLPHRLERIGEYQNISFYNDSLATIPQATIQALQLFKSKVYTLIAGGFDRGIDYSPLSKAIEKSSVKTLILFPTTGEKILRAMHHAPQHFFAKNMKEAVRLSYEYTPKGGICLLSPASSSFNMFKNYEDRGNQFKKFVVLYAKKK